MHFITLLVLKHGGQWYFLAILFNMKGLYFERFILKYIGQILPILYSGMVEFSEEHYTITRLRTDGHTFRNVPYSRYATYVTFQQGYLPTGTMVEGNSYFSGNLKLYGSKVDVSVLPSGLTIHSTVHYPGPVSDLDIFRRARTFHETSTAQSESDTGKEDVGILSAEFGGRWAILLDKGYQGVQEFLRGVHPIRNPINDCLTVSEERLNEKMSGDRDIVESLFFLGWDFGGL